MPNGPEPARRNSPNDPPGGSDHLAHSSGVSLTAASLGESYKPFALLPFGLSCQYLVIVINAGEENSKSEMSGGTCKLEIPARHLDDPKLHELVKQHTNSGKRTTILLNNPAHAPLWMDFIRRLCPEIDGNSNIEIIVKSSGSSLADIQKLLPKEHSSKIKLVNWVSSR